MATNKTCQDTQPVVIPAVCEKPTVSIEHAGRALGLSRPVAYRAALNGFIPTIKTSAHRYFVPTSALRQMLGLPLDGPTLTVGGKR